MRKQRRKRVFCIIIAVSLIVGTVLPLLVSVAG